MGCLFLEVLIDFNLFLGCGLMLGEFEKGL